MISYLPGAWESVDARDQFEAHYALIWHPHLDAYPVDARMTVSYPSGRAGQINPKTGKIGPPPLDSSHVDLHDMDSIWACIERREAVPTHPGQPGGNTWIGAAPRMPGLERWQRGAGKYCHPIPALWVDLDVDVAGATHKLGGLPTIEQAEEMIRACPLPPTLIVWTGGGFHIWWGLLPGNLLDKGFAVSRAERQAGVSALLTEAQEADSDLIERHKAWWIGEAHRRGVRVDGMVIGDATRVLRMAGSVNGKYGSTCRIVRLRPDMRWSRADLDAMLPPLPDKIVVARHARENRVAKLRVALASDSARPGDRLAAQVATGDLLEALGMDEGTSNSWWSPDGGTNHEVHARLYADDGGETVTVFDRTLQGAWGLEDCSHALDAWGVLGQAVCGSDWALAGRMAHKHIRKWATLIKVVAERPEAGELQERYPRPKGRATRTTVSRDRLVEIMAARQGGVA